MTSTIVPANGEVLIWMQPDIDALDDEDPYSIDQSPIVAWRVVAEGDGFNEVWGEPILHMHSSFPESSTGETKNETVTAILMPSGKVYATDGSEHFGSVEAFAERWRKYYSVIRDRARE